MTNTISIELPDNNSTGLDEAGGLGIPIDIKSLVNVFFKRFWLIAITTVVVFSYISYKALSQTPIYKANVQVIVDSKQLNVINLDDVLRGTSLSTPVLDTEVRIMASHALLRRVVIDQNLIEDPEFNPALREEKVSFATRIQRQIFGFLLPKKEEPEQPRRALTPEQREQVQIDRAARLLARKVRVSRVGTTYILSAEVTSTSPQTAARLANAIADQYRVDQMEAKLDATERATMWLAERVSVLRDELAEKENAVEEYKAATGILAAQGSSLTESNIATLQSQKLALEADLTRARARYNGMRRQIDSGAGIDSIAEVLDSPVISNLKSQRSVVQRRVADLRATYGPRHPDLISAVEEADDIEKQMRAEVDRIAARIEGEVKVAEDQLANVNRRLSQNRAQLIQENAADVRLRELERDALASRTFYEEFIARFKETSEQGDLVEAEARILTAATVPGGPAAPRPKVSMFIGFMLGGALGCLLALVAEIFDSKISSTTDIERRLKVPALGNVPLITNVGFLGFGRKKPADYMVENPLSGYAEGIRYLRAAIAFSDIDSQTKTVAITSSLPDEGKTSLTLSLGRMSAMSGSKTLVIDGDFRRRQLTDAADVKVETGLVEYLFGEGQLADVIQTDKTSGLDILPLSKEGHTPHDVFGTKSFDKLHAELRERYDLILIDTGPLLLMAEARVIAGKADKTILIVRWRRTTRPVIRKSLGLLKAFRADVLGLVLNMVDLNHRRQHNEPGTAYRDYKKYYRTEAKRRFSFGRSNKSQEKAKPAKAAEKPVRAVEPAREPEPVD